MVAEQTTGVTVKPEESKKMEIELEEEYQKTMY